ncbi:MAG TPA: YHS domain-containing (seleno)protein [Xanthobacteraceae bacterium]|jgi:hypothetical protein
MSNIPRREFLTVAAFAFTICLGGGFAAAQTGSRPAGRRTALSGYDPVSYFTPGRPEKGASEFSFAFDDAIYLFRDAEHRAMFSAEPERYAPQYAGYCAGGVSEGYKTESDPEAWAILNGKLFVFQLKDKVAEFKRDLSFIEKADVNWRSLHDTPSK